MTIGSSAKEVKEEDETPLGQRVNHDAFTSSYPRKSNIIQPYTASDSVKVIERTKSA